MNDSINRYLSILCYPFASLDFFFEDYLEKIAADQDQRIGTEARLRESVIRYIQRTGTVYSYDEIYLYLEKCYLYSMRIQNGGSALEVYPDAVNKIAESMISQRDGRIVFKYWENRNDGDFLGDLETTTKFLFSTV